eukprot:PRCOL_00000121-RA
MALRGGGGDGGVRELVEKAAGEAVESVQRVGSSGWSSQATYALESGRRLFVKTSGESADGMFAGEAASLRAMRHAALQAPDGAPALVIPDVLHYGPTLDAEGMPALRGSLIVMDHLNLGARGSQGELGEALARMHAAEPLAPEAAAGQYGFPMDNTIGGTPQPNGWMDDWVAFFAERRLRHQCRLARDPELSKLGDLVAKRLPELMEGAELRPATLHGDLWSGNIGGVGGSPSVFDPATYYGHAEAEFGMSWCAGFGPDFYAGYFGVLPKQPGHDQRATLYEAYHYLNHFNLFGGSYYSGAVDRLRRLA